MTKREEIIAIATKELEEWRIFPLDSNYKVSTLGKIKSIDRVVKHGNRTRKAHGRTLKQYISNDYLYASINRNSFLVHRAVLITFEGDEPNKQGNHKNGIKTDCRLSNLEWSTNQENRDHAVKNDLIAFGQRTGGSKLKDSEVEEILQINSMYGVRGMHIATEYNISRSTVCDLFKGRTWVRSTKQIGL